MKDHDSLREARADARGGAEWTPSTRTLYSGRQLGKSAIRALQKNIRTNTVFDELIDNTKHLREDLLKNSITIGRVIRPVGDGRLEVVSLTLDTKVFSVVRLPIAKTIKFRGIASNKTDRAYCMCGGDMVVINGGFISGKLSLSLVDKAQSAFQHASIRYPKGFFIITPVYDITESTDDDDGIDFERI